MVAGKSSVLNYLIVVLPVVITVGAAVVMRPYFKTRSLMKSLEDIAFISNAIKCGNFTKKLSLSSNSQISHVAEAVNQMIESVYDRENRIKFYQLQLYRQKDYLESILNSLADGLMIISSDLTIVNVNPSVMLWIGLSDDEIIGKKFVEFIQCECSVICPTDFCDADVVCPIVSQNERLAPIEAKVYNRKTHAEKSLGLNVSQVIGSSGDPRFVILLRDITEFKEMENLKSDFVATLTHDLRVPILAEANTLKLFLKGSFGQLNEKQKFAMENMLESNSGLLELVNTLLDAYKYDAGKNELTKEPVDLKKLSQECISELYSLSRKNNQTIENRISQGIPQVNADKSEIKRVIKNLLSNSITYTPKGGHITLDAETEEGEVIFKVIDNGKGISADEIDFIFDRYFSKAKKFRKIGTGLGLYLSKQIIEKHNGKIWVESKLSEGSTFYFSLPVNEE